MKSRRLACLLLLLVSAAHAENWPSWRGPNSNGVATSGDFPTQWSNTENVRWKATLPGKGSSTPIVWGERIFLTCGMGKDNAVVCFDRQGKQLWQVAIGSEKPGKHKKATGSNSSPVTDGEHLFVYFKSGDLACLDFAGKLVWQKNLQKLYGEDTLWWDLGTSPVLTKNHVVVACMHSGPSYVAAFAKDSGQEAWKHDRNLDAPVEAAQSYTTPVVVTEGGRETIVVLGADHVTAHDSANGKELWRVSGLNPSGNSYFRSISSAVVADGVVVAPYARGGSLTAIKLGGSGDVTKSHVAWRKNASADVPTPAAADGKAFVCNDKGDIACYDLQSGAEIAKHSGEKSRFAYSSSPIVAGGKVYVGREDGKVFVVELVGKELKAIAANSLGDGELLVSTPVLVDGQVLLRTLDNLYCIGK